MRRLLVLAALAFGLLAPAARAHPLGNFSVNHLSVVSVSRDRVDVTWYLDKAEIPTFQERGRTRGEVLAAARAAVARHLVVRAGGRRLALVPARAPRLTHPPGQGGLPLTRIVLPLRARVAEPRRVTVRDGTFADRVGWAAVVAAPGRGTDVVSSAPSGDPTRRLTAYPRAGVAAPLHVREARLDVRPGTGELTAPRVPGGSLATAAGTGSSAGFAGLFADAAAGRGVLLLFLLAAFGWGAVHALSPGHGKAMVAAYLVGSRGTARHALALGATVTLTHTAGVFALGLVTLLLAQWVVPEQLYPWLNLVAGLMVVGIGGAALRNRWRARGRAHDHHHHHHHGPPERITARGIVAMGASAGLVPCPSALVVLLAAIAQHELALGLLLIVAFSLGLATTLSVLGLLVVGAGRVTARLPVPGRLAGALPAASALVIVALGVVLTARAVPSLV